MKANGMVCCYCGGCVGVCPTDAIRLEEIRIEVDSKKCTNCGICEKFCPVGALRNEGKK
jgi:ferredoxin